MKLQRVNKTRLAVATIFIIFGICLSLIGIGLLLSDGSIIFVFMTITGGAIMIGRSTVSILQELRAFQ